MQKTANRFLLVKPVLGGKVQDVDAAQLSVGTIVDYRFDGRNDIMIGQVGADHWTLFRSLVLDAGARGNAIPDATLAALALEHGATWVTTDRGFARFTGLRSVSPLN